MSGDFELVEGHTKVEMCGNFEGVEGLGRLFIYLPASFCFYLQDPSGVQKYLGVTHHGIVTFQGNKRTHLFKWSVLRHISIVWYLVGIFSVLRH